VPALSLTQPWLAISLPLQLAAAVQQAKSDAGGTLDLWQLGVLLRSRHGYLVRHRKANMRRRSRAYLRQLRHAYLVVTGLEGQTGE
jgi:hypothetical protein